MIARTTALSLFPALLLALAAAALLAALPRPPGRVAVLAGAEGPFITEGETAQIRSFYGFYEPESAGATSFRWTNGTGNLVVRSGARLGEPLVLNLRLCRCRSDAQEPQLLLRLNGETLADASPTVRRAEWRRYTLLVPPRSPPYAPDLLIELLSDAAPNANFGYLIGIAFERAELSALPIRQPAYPRSAALGLGALVGALVLVARRRGASPRGALLTGAAGLALVTAQGLLYQAHPLPAAILACGLLLGLGLALLLGRSPGTTAALALLLGALALAPQALGVWMLDDAFISFRYARNALLGHGFVFNPGERVEGYTNFLWTALFVPTLALGAPPAPASQALTLACALATAALAWVGARRLTGPAPALTALTLLIPSAPFVLYTARGSGMETALFTLLLLGGVLAYLYRPSRMEDGQSVVGGRWSVVGAGVLLALAAMTRPEGVLVAGVTGLHLLLGVWRVGRGEGPQQPSRAHGGVSGISAFASSAAASWMHQRRWRQPLAFTVGFLAIFGPYYLWRLAYYGYPLPNTFYAKVGGTSAQALRGLRYLGDFAVSQAPLLALALLAGLLACLGRLSRMEDGGWRMEDGASSGHPPSSIFHPQSVVGYLWLLIGVYTLYIVAVGGDHFPLYRFFVPLLPPLALLAAPALGGIGAALPGRIAAPALALLAVAGAAWQLPQLYESRTLNAAGQVWGENSVVEKNREIGLWLREHTPSDALIATGIAGALPYYAERPVLELAGPERPAHRPPGRADDRPGHRRVGEDRRRLRAGPPPGLHPLQYRRSISRQPAV